jgi:hypothetical protein
MQCKHVNLQMATPSVFQVRASGEVRLLVGRLRLHLVVFLLWTRWIGHPHPCGVMRCDVRRCRIIGRRHVPLPAGGGGGGGPPARCHAKLRTTRNRTARSQERGNSAASRSAVFCFGGAWAGHGRRLQSFNNRG